MVPHTITNTITARRASMTTEQNKSDVKVTVEVTHTYEGKIDTFENATGWHIDEERQLHVRGTVGNLASYGVGCWTAVKLVDSAE